MTTPELLRQYIAADLAARALAAGIEINDEWDFPAESLCAGCGEEGGNHSSDCWIEYDAEEDPNYEEDGTAGFLHHSFWEK